MTWALKNIGLMFLGLCVCLAAMSADHFADTLAANTEQLQKQCSSSGASLAYAVSASALKPMPTKGIKQ